MRFLAADAGPASPGRRPWLLIVLEKVWPSGSCTPYQTSSKHLDDRPSGACTRMRRRGAAQHLAVGEAAVVAHHDAVLLQASAAPPDRDGAPARDSRRPAQSDPRRARAAAGVRQVVLAIRSRRRLRLADKAAQQHRLQPVASSSTRTMAPARRSPTRRYSSRRPAQRSPARLGAAAPRGAPAHCEKRFASQRRNWSSSDSCCHKLRAGQHLLQHGQAGGGLVVRGGVQLCQPRFAGDPARPARRHSASAASSKGATVIRFAGGQLDLLASVATGGGLLPASSARSACSRVLAAAARTAYSSREAAARRAGRLRWRQPGRVQRAPITTSRAAPVT